jgi:hypothetical protein
MFSHKVLSLMFADHIIHGFTCHFKELEYVPTSYSITSNNQIKWVRRVYRYCRCSNFPSSGTRWPDKFKLPRSLLYKTYSKQTIRETALLWNLNTRHKQHFLFEKYCMTTSYGTLVYYIVIYTIFIWTKSSYKQLNHNPR